jgi:hypothetical protein
MDSKQEIIYSAIGSIAIYIILILSFLVYIKTSEVKKVNAAVKTTVLQLDVVIESKNNIQEKIKPKNILKNSDLAEKVVKKTTSKSAKKSSSLKSLFANVNTSVKKTSKKKVLNVKSSSISSRFKSKFDKEKKVDNIVLSKLSEKSKPSSNKKMVSIDKNKDEQDPYYSKIYQILSSRWNPTIFDNDLKAKVNIIIFNNGKFSYKFIQYSGNDGFDEQLKFFLNSQTDSLYPISPSNKTVNIEITFQSKG